MIAAGSSEDSIWFLQGTEIPPVMAGFPHSVALLPSGVNVAGIGAEGSRFAGVYMVDPGCASGALNDPLLDSYLSRRFPVLLYMARARDLGPFLRRRDAFRRRGYSLERLR